MKGVVGIVAAIGLVSCSPPMERRTYSDESLAREVAAAMCSADAEKRAEAIASVSGKSEGYPMDEVSDRVYDIATGIAKSGCPSTAPGMSAPVR